MMKATKFFSDSKVIPDKMVKFKGKRRKWLFWANLAIGSIALIALMWMVLAL